MSSNQAYEPVVLITAHTHRVESFQHADCPSIITILLSLVPFHKHTRFFYKHTRSFVFSLSLLPPAPNSPELKLSALA